MRPGPLTIHTWKDAFTLTELMISTSIFVMVVIGIISSHLFGMRMLVPMNARQQAADESRKLLNALANEVRAARTVKIGSGTVSSFSEAGMNSLQRGNAMQLYPTTNNTIYIRYYRDSSSKSLRRITNSSSAYTLAASGITTTYPFTFEDYAGNTLTNDQMNSVLAINFQFNEVGTGGQAVGSGKYFTSYNWKTRIYRRALQ